MPAPLVAPLVGAGIGFLGSLFGGRPKVAGVDPLTNDAIANWKQMIGYGNTGFDALSGDPNAVARMMNPYDQTMNPFWDMLRQRGLSQVGSNATLQGAFGGDRHAISEGQMLADVNNGQAAQRYGEFGNAMNRAGLLANFGFGANQDLYGASQYLRDVRQQQLNGQYRNPFGAAIGGAMIGASLFPGNNSNSPQYGATAPGIPGDTSGFPGTGSTFDPNKGFCQLFGGC